MTKVNPDFIIHFYLRHIEGVSMCKEKWEKIITGKPKLKRKLFSTVNPNTKNEMPPVAHKIGRRKLNVLPEGWL